MKEIINCKHNAKCLNFYFFCGKKQISSIFCGWPLIFHDFRHLAIKISCGLPRLRLLNQLEVKLIARDLLPHVKRMKRGATISLVYYGPLCFF